ncbi:HMG domain-containing 3 isoform X2 [Labeo rohita]|uniref:HMG domain-containing 3 isoform X2 n=1 Tax=Labeo rohita TaxID=84645 RepID=A0A498N830_LABRO|nr:HMG domain-containing 3 isoform X2 [Labeo rohita]
MFSCSWITTAQLHRYQLKQRKEYNLRAYVLDRAKDPSEDLLQLSSAQTLKRSDFWSLAFDELEATILKPKSREILFFDSMNPGDFGHGSYIQTFRKLASHISPGHWNMSVLADFEGAPLQLGGIDCGVFMLMYALHVTLSKPFDFAATTSEEQHIDRTRSDMFFDKTALLH